MEKLKACPFCGGKVSIALCGTRKESYWEVTRAAEGNICKCRAFMESELFERKNKTAAKICRSQLISAWNRRAAPENKALTLFDKITESPEKLAKFLGAIDIGKIELDECFCKSDCGDDSGCPHELQCIINWLDKPEGSKKS